MPDLSDLLGLPNEARKQLQRAYSTQVRPRIEELGGNAFTRLGQTLQTIERPAGAIRSTIRGQGPAAGWNAEVAPSFIDPTDPFALRMLGGIADTLTDPTVLVGAKWLQGGAKAGSFGTRFLREAAVDATARNAGYEIARHIDEDAPAWQRVGLPILGGLTAGVAAYPAVRRLGPSTQRSFAQAVQAPPDIQSATMRRILQPPPEPTMARVPPAVRQVVEPPRPERAWLMPDGSDVDLGPRAALGRDARVSRFHETFAQESGFESEAAFIENGAVRKAAPGAYQIRSMTDEQSLRRVELDVNKDLAAGKRIENVIIDTIEQDEYTGGYRSTTLPVPPAGAFTTQPRYVSPVQAFHNATPDEQNMWARLAEQNLDRNPGQYLAAATPPAPTTDIAQLTRHAEEDAIIASTDDISRQLKTDMLNGATTGDIPEINTDFTMEVGTLLSERYRTLSGTTAALAVDIQDQMVKNMVPEVKVRFAPTWAARVVNGWANRSPLVRAVAPIWGNYMKAQRTPVAMVMHEVDSFVKSQFGQVGEKVSLKVDAPNDVRRAFELSQKGQYGNAAVGIIAEHPEFFNLSDDQLMFMRDLQTLMDYDVRLSGQFGVDTSFMYLSMNEAIDAARKAGDAAEVGRLTAARAAGETISGVKRVQNYARHMVELAGPDGKPLSPEMRVSYLEHERSFQQHRLLDSWADVVNSAADVGQFQGRIQGAMRRAVEAGDIEEASRLQDLMRQGVQPLIRRGSFAESVAERLAQSSRQRAEAGAMKAIRTQGGNIRAEEELKSLLNSAHIPDWLKIPAEAAGAIRSLQLRADFSLLGVQSWGALAMGRGLKGGIDGGFADFLRTIGTDEGWARYHLANAPKMTKWALHDLNLNETILELPDDLDLMRRQHYLGKQSLGGTLTTKGTLNPLNYLTEAANAMDKVQFGRLMTAYKVDMAEHTLGLLQAARDGKLGFGDMLTHPSLAVARIGGTFKGQTDAQLMRAASSFTNNLFGGLNATAQGRSAIHTLVENIFVLTPGFTRGTVSIGLQAGNLLKWTPENVLARDFAVRGTLLAGMMIKGLAMAINGLNPDGTQVEVNVTDPSRDDWMVIPLPDGSTIRPLSRWRSTGKIVGETIDTMMKAGPIEATAMFSEDTLRWATYRQSGLVTSLLGDPVGRVGEGWFGAENVGNPYARGHGLLDIALDPQSDKLAQLQGVATGLMPVAAGSAAETYIQPGDELKRRGTGKDVAFALGMELIGMGQTQPTMMEKNVRSTGGEIALEYGIPEDVVSNAIVAGDNPIYLKDAAGNYLLTSQQRKDAVQRVAAATGLSEDIVRRGGRPTAAERLAILKGIEDAQTENFFAGLDFANAEYATAMRNAEEAAKNGMPLSQVSKYISDARVKRFAAKEAVEAINPAATAFLQSPDQMSKQHSFDALMSAISADAYSKDKDFFNEETLSFDFKARDEWYASLRRKYGGAFDTWEDYQDRNKTDLERARDNAFDRLGTYFRVEDELWLRLTGGALGETEAEFDQTLREQLMAAGATDPGMQNFLISQIKQNIKPIALTHTYTDKVRNLMRASDPVLEQDVTNWLGAQPIALKELSKRDRAMVNQLLVMAD